MPYCAESARKLQLFVVHVSGDLESYREAVRRCEAQMKRVQERRVQVTTVIIISSRTFNDVNADARL